MAIEQIFLTSRIAFDGIPLPTDALFFSPFAESQSTLELIRNLQSYYSPFGSSIGSAVINQNGFLSETGQVIAIPTSDCFIDLDHNIEGGSGQISIVGTKFEGNGSELVGGYFIRKGEIVSNITAGDASTITVDAGVLATDLLDMTQAAPTMAAQKIKRRLFGEELFVNGYSFTRSAYIEIPEITHAGDFGGSSEINRRDVSVSMAILGHSTGSDRVWISGSGQVFATIAGVTVASTDNVVDPAIDYEIDWTRTGSDFVVNLNGLEVINDTVGTGSVSFDRIARSASDSDSFRGRISELKLIEGVSLSRHYPIKDGAGATEIEEVISGENGTPVKFYAASWLDNWNDQPNVNYYREAKFSISAENVDDEFTAGMFVKNLQAADQEGFLFQGETQSGFKASYTITNDGIDYDIGFQADSFQNGDVFTVKIFVSEEDGIVGILERDGYPPSYDSISSSIEAPDANFELTSLLISDNQASITMQRNTIGAFNP